MSKIKAGLIQTALKGNSEMSSQQIRDKMREAPVPLIASVGRQGYKCDRRPESDGQLTQLG